MLIINLINIIKNIYKFSIFIIIINFLDKNKIKKTYYI